MNFEFIDADDYHPIENKILMSNGIGLNDDQRLPWLLSLHNKLRDIKALNKGAVLACSALKSKYRKILTNGLNESKFLSLKFILLNINYDLVEKRLISRQHQFVKGASILKSQFELLEIDDDFSYKLLVTENKNIENCADEIINFLNKDFQQ